MNEIDIKVKFIFPKFEKYSDLREPRPTSALVLFPFHSSRPPIFQEKQSKTLEATLSCVLMFSSNNQRIVHLFETFSYTILILIYESQVN